MNRDLSKLQQQLNVSFNDPLLLRQAFTHASFVNEHRKKNDHNERLEFLGDAVLELIVSHYLFTMFPAQPEGELTKLRASIVCEPSLAMFAQQLQFGDYVLLGKGEELSGGRERPALLADVFESFIGALYLDQGLNAVETYLQTFVLDHIFQSEHTWIIDHKSQLQEYVQHYNLGVLDYRIIDERGPAHDREFVTEVMMGSTHLGQGSGRSKKESEQQAAAKAIAKLHNDRK